MEYTEETAYIQSTAQIVFTQISNLVSLKKKN